MSKYNDLGLTNYRSDQEQINYIKVSEIVEKDINIDGLTIFILY